MTLPEIDVGARIRAYRKRKGLSLNQLSRLTGIAASNLSCIELNKSSPTLNTLRKIAHAFDTKASVFLEDLLYPRAILYPQGTGQQVPGTPVGLTVVLLTAQLERNCFEAKLIFLEPGSGPFTATDPCADHFVHCLAGTAVARVKGDSHELRKGDSLYVRPDADLEVENRSDEKSGILLVTSRPIDASPWCIRDP